MLKRLNQSGYNLVELAIAVAILSVLASSVMLARSFMAKQTVATTDQSYATQKAIQMFEELKALVHGNEQLGVQVLDNYSDGSAYNPVLTTDRNVDVPAPGVSNPGDPLSGNRTTNGHWRYIRQVQVNHVSNDPNVRQVIINIWLYGSDAAPLQPGKLLATLGGQLQTITNIFPPTQVLDVYVLSLANVVGWFTSVPEMYSTFWSVLDDMQSRNPGLEIRRHFIIQTGYGRDPLYNPFINVNQNTATSGGLPWVYFYPGRTTDDTGTEQMFFSNDGRHYLTDQPQAGAGLEAIGTVLTDEGPGNTTAIQNANAAAICDAYNHDMRYPDELAAYQAVSQNAYDAGTNPFPQITLRMLYEQMASSPTSFLNAIVVSMHGEVVPLPAIRNFSDPAKDPADALGWAAPSATNMRVVTHPSLIHYPTGASGVTMRVYSYYDGLESPFTLDTSAATTVGNNQEVPLMTVLIKGVNLTAGVGVGQVAVSCIYGGVNSGVTYDYGRTLLNPSTGDPAGMGMSWVISGASASGTTLTFYNTPLRCPLVVPTGTPTPVGSSGGGLPVANRLYNSEYIPCAVDTNLNYNTDLTSPVTNLPKNTARWVIMVHPGGGTMSDGQYAIETRLGNNFSGTNPAENLSRTYVWIGGPAGCVPGNSNCGITPFTERFQFEGDPRDCPYLDVKFGSTVLTTSDPYVTIDPDSYNWYFKNISTNPTDGYSGFTKTTAGYNGGNGGDNRDLPRYYYLFRQAMLGNQALFVNLNGYTAWHADQGGEFGDVYAPFASSINFIETPWVPNNTTNTMRVNEIEGGAPYNGTNILVRDNGGTNKPVSQWYARWWRGENYPDDWATTWTTYGNLPTGSGKFYRTSAQYVTMYSGANSTNGFDGRGIQRSVGGKACADFMNGNTTTSTFMHTTNSAGATLTPLGLNLYVTTNYPLPVTTFTKRPWDLTQASGGPSAFGTAYYTALRTTLSIPSPPSKPSRQFYNMVTGSPFPYAVDTIEMDLGGQTAYYNISGLDTSGTFDAYALSEVGFATSLRMFFDGGLYTSAQQHITQLPLVKTWVNSPNSQYFSPSSISVTLSGAVTDVNGNPTTNVWFRYPGITSSTANYYTEEYPNFGLPMTTIAGAYTEPGMVFQVNFKYSTDQGANWLFCQDGSPALAGVLNTSPTYCITTGVMPVQFTWNVSNTNQFSQGDYWLRGEVYRQGFPLHYSYSIDDVTINR